jgi:pyruvate kinase
MIREGMDVARVNFAHGSRKDHVSYIRKIRQIAEQQNRNVAIMQDLPGPKNRIGKVRKSGINLVPGTNFIFTTRQILGDEKKVSVEWMDLPRKIKKGMAVFLNDGTIKLEVISAGKEEIVCRVINGESLAAIRV